MATILAKPTIDVGIVTKNKQALLDFYGEVVGFPTLPEVPMDGFVVSRFQVGDCVLKVLEYENPPAIEHSASELGDATGIRYFTVSVTNLDEILLRCKEAGRPLVDGPTEVRPGVTIALVSDPDGNILEFVNRPPAGE